MFKVILPNVNAESTIQPSVTAQPLTPEEQVIKLTAEKGVINRKEVEALLGLSQTPAGQLLKKLADWACLSRTATVKTRNISPKTKVYNYIFI